MDNTDEIKQYENRHHVFEIWQNGRCIRYYDTRAEADKAIKTMGSDCKIVDFYEDKYQYTPENILKKCPIYSNKNRKITEDKDLILIFNK